MSRAHVALLCGALIAPPAWGQNPPRPVKVDPLAASIPTIELTSDLGEGTNQRTGRGVTPLIAPLPFHNSQIGWGGVLMLGLIHRFDADTMLKPSTAAVAGFASENGSWGVMLVMRVSLR